MAFRIESTISHGPIARRVRGERGENTHIVRRKLYAPDGRNRSHPHFEMPRVVVKGKDVALGY